MVRETQYRAGGATSNTGHALARLGMPVEYMTVLGDDTNGDILLNLWQQDGIDTRYVVRSSDAGTALSTIPVYQDGKRGVYFCPGTNDIMDLTTCSAHSASIWRYCASGSPFISAIRR